MCIIFSFNSCYRQNVRDNKILIAVSIPPQAWFVSQIAGEKARSLVLVLPGQNPHNYEPGPRQIQGLSSAAAWILSGSEFEISLYPKVVSLFPNLLVVDGTEGVRFRTLEEHEDEGHEHFYLEPQPSPPQAGEGSPLTIDRHTWLGREPAKILAAHIRNTLSMLDNANETYYSERYENLVSMIDDEFDKLIIDLAPLNGKSVFVYHPSFGYFLDEFGIRQEAVETGGKEPGPRELSKLAARLNEERAAAIFVQTQFPVNAARTLAASAGAELIGLDPLAEDWLENIRRMGRTLEMSALNRTGRAAP
jgi:zinc transport system substrate-binding protein